MFKFSLLYQYSFNSAPIRISFENLNNIFYGLFAGIFVFLYTQILIVKLAKAVNILFKEVHFAIVAQFFKLQSKRENVVSERVDFGNINACGRKLSQNVVRGVIWTHKEIVGRRTALVNQSLTCVLQETARKHFIIQR